jgi:hypothetical protein
MTGPTIAVRDMVTLTVSRHEAGDILDALEEHGRDDTGYRYRPEIQRLQYEIERQLLNQPKGG